MSHKSKYYLSKKICQTGQIQGKNCHKCLINFGEEKKQKYHKIFLKTWHIYWGNYANNIYNLNVSLRKTSFRLTAPDVWILTAANLSKLVLFYFIEHTHMFNAKLCTLVYFIYFHDCHKKSSLGIRFKYSSGYYLKQNIHLGIITNQVQGGGALF